MAADTNRELIEVAEAVRAHLEFEQQMATPGLFPVRLHLSVPQPTASAPPGGSLERPVGLDSRPDAGAKAAERVGQGAASARPAASGLPSAGLSPAERRRQLAALAAEAQTCRACALHEKRTRSVFARGNPESELVFVGEGPGREEDAQGLPFVGAAGQLLDRMIAAMGFQQDEIYICNVVKCRPPDNRTPRPEEALACTRFLHPQLDLVAPKVIVALGKCAAEHLGLVQPTGPWRGRWGEFRGVPVMATYHPAFLLRSPQFKKTVWKDLQLVMARLGRTPGSS